MNEDVLARVQKNPKFAELVSKKTSFGWMLSIVMLAIYYGFILILAFNPQSLGTSLSGGVITVGIPVGLFIIISAFLLTGVYVRKANTEFDQLNQETTAILNSAEMQKFIRDRGSEPAPTTPADMDRFVASEIVEWGKAVKQSGASAE